MHLSLPLLRKLHLIISYSIKLVQIKSTEGHNKYKAAVKDYYNALNQ